MVCKFLPRPNKKIPVFRITGPYLNVLVKPRFFRVFFWGKKIILCILKGKMPFKMHKIIIFFQKKNYVYLPNLKFSDLLPESSNTHFSFGLLTKIQNGLFHKSIRI